MSTTKVPTDPNLSHEMRRFLDDVSRAEKRLTDYVDEQIDDLPDFASKAEAEAGTSETVMMNPLRTAQAIAALNPFGNAFLHVRDEKAQNTAGGDFTAGARRTRTLNTVVKNTISGASLSSDTITLPAGTYFAIVRAPARSVTTHKVWLRDTTGGTDLLTGSTEFTFTTAVQTNSWAYGQFTIASQSDVTVQHEAATTVNTTGLGVASNLGTEVYAEVMIWKLS